MTVTRLTGILLLSIGALCGQPVDSMLVVETSPGTEQAIGLINPGVLPGEDRAGVIAFGIFRTAEVLQPLTEDRDKLRSALRQAGRRIGLAVGGRDREPLNFNFTVDLAAALRAACSELGQLGANERKRAIVVFFAGEDPTLSAHLDSLQTILDEAGARLYAVVIQRTDEPSFLAAPRTGASSLPKPSPVVTPQLISRLAERSGGRLFRRNWDLKKILALARKP